MPVLITIEAVYVMTWNGSLLLLVLLVPARLMFLEQIMTLALDVLELAPTVSPLTSSSFFF